MNSHKVTYLLNGEEHYDHITERTEKAAQKRLKGIYKDAEITDTELTSTDVNATKEQERETLEKIKAIVATLGPRSYVGTALDGCLVDAEVNIENDFGDSMRARWMEAENRVAQAAREAAAAKEELEAVRKHLQTAEDDANFYRDKVLDSDDLTDIAQLIDGHISQLRDMVKASEVAILENAEHPEAKIFTDAVRDRKNLTKDIEYYQALAQRIKHAQGQ